MDTFLPILAQYGIVGVILTACGMFVIYRDKTNAKSGDVSSSRHENERKEWREIIDRQHQECIKARMEATEAVLANTTVLTKIITLIEDRR